MEQVALCWVLVFCNAATETIMNNQPTRTTPEKLLRIPGVIERMGVSRSYWWAGVRAGKFPQGRKLSARVTVWPESEIDALIAKIGK